MVNTAAAAPSRGLLLLLLGLGLLTGSASTTPYDPPTVPELMDRFGLPRALLPVTARRYLLHSDGSFELFLDDGCEVKARGYRVMYDIRLAGSVVPGAVTGLQDVRVRVLFVWVPVTGVEVGGGVVSRSHLSSAGQGHLVRIHDRRCLLDVLLPPDGPRPRRRSPFTTRPLAAAILLLIGGLVFLLPAGGYCEAGTKAPSGKAVLLLLVHPLLGSLFRLRSVVAIVLSPAAASRDCKGCMLFVGLCCCYLIVFRKELSKRKSRNTIV